jgi:YNFM family putative membrane transporter
MAESTATALIRPGTPTFRRSSLALFAGGFGTFMLLYGTQTLLPMLAATFEVSPAASSLALSASTGILSVMILVAGGVAERIGYKRVMGISLLAAALLTIASAGSPGFGTLVVFRLAIGVALSGLPVCIMAYLGERMAPESVGLAMGLSIGGNALGGLAGRVATGVIADHLGWRWSMVITGAAGLMCALLFWLLLPPVPIAAGHRPARGHTFGAFTRHFRDPGLRWLFAWPFLLMGSFVSLYNYIGFHLSKPPFGWSQTEIACLFGVYVFGIGSSTLAGRLADRFGRRHTFWIGVAVAILGTLLTLAPSGIAVVVGVTLVTSGFFAAHAIASSWVSRRAVFGRAQASSLYLFFYYAGSTVIGSGAGIVYGAWGWGGIVVTVILLQLAGLAIALRLTRLVPLPA